MTALPSTTATDWNALPDEEFRAIVRDTFAEYPEHLRFVSRRLLWAEQAQWWLKMSEIGWIAPSWPTDFGGMGLGPDKLLIYFEEQERVGVTRFQDHGIRMIGPILMKYGSAEQRDKFLPGILSCRDRYAQGYSEPGSGSDLASLRTTARADGQDWVINGTKIWTTMAHDATHVFLLAKTSPDAPAPEAISFFLVPLDSPGITVRTIRDMAGEEELCEVFLDDVQVPGDHLIGPVNQGWTVAKSVLGFERLHVGSPQLPESALHALRDLLASLDGDATTHRQLAGHALDVAHLRAAYGYFAARLRQGTELGPEVSMLKLLATETFQQIAETIIELAGPAGSAKGGGLPDRPEPPVLGTYYRARPSTIYGGSSEIQRNILAKRVLRLPQ